MMSTKHYAVMYDEGGNALAWLRVTVGPGDTLELSADAFSSRVKISYEVGEAVVGSNTIKLLETLPKGIVYD